jgi:hypothetical protein
MQAKKATPQHFSLNTVAGRVALLTGIVEGVVLQKEIMHAVIQDTEKRPYRKPVVAYGKRYPSVTAAALANSGAVGRKAVNAMQKNIARWCNEDCHVGFYWSE